MQSYFRGLNSLRHISHSHLAVRSFTLFPRLFSSSSSSFSNGDSNVIPTGVTPDGVYTQNIPTKKGSFRDRARFLACGGDGGHGCSSMDTDPYGNGGPDGANGGKGGDVWLSATNALDSFTFQANHFQAEEGANGRSKYQRGENGRSLFIPVPAGTIVSEILETDLKSRKFTLKLLADLQQEGESIMVASGGQGGLGNKSFKSYARKGGRFSTLGEKGQRRWLWLELKSIADIGLIGYPNAGKSSLLARISNATPKIAPYPFTTLHPNVGIVNSFYGSTTPTGADEMSTLKVADLPGLVEGASQNRGLGLEFLKHVQRTRILLYVLDLPGTDGRDCTKDFQSLQYELGQYDPTLLTRPSLIFCNKTDLKQKLCVERLSKLREMTNLPIITGSCKSGTNLTILVQTLFHMIKQQEEDKIKFIQQQAELLREEENRLYNRKKETRQARFEREKQLQDIQSEFAQLNDDDWLPEKVKKNTRNKQEQEQE